MENLLFIFEITGIFVFAVSGALAGVRAGMDLFGITVMALMPAVGGGTLRDLVLDQPVFWIEGTRTIWIALLGAGITFLFAKHMEAGQGKRLFWLTWADAVGLALFCAVGAEKALNVTGSNLIAVMMGVVTGVAGGMLRDVLSNEVPLVMKKGEVYATAAFAGSGAFCLLAFLHLPGSVVLWAAMLTAFVVRAGGIIWKWSLPEAMH